MWRSAALVTLAAALLGGCGLGAGATPSAVSLTVTRNFGATPVPASGPLKVEGQETVMSLLMRNYTVQTRYDGGFVQTIAGHSGNPQGSPPIAWFYFVNGLEAPKGASATNVHAGDRVWWDLHNWAGTEQIPAVVGSFPAPFISGINGKRLPVRVECAPSSQSACQAVAGGLQHYGIPAALAGISEGEKPETLRILVGPWKALDYEGAVRVLASGPSVSGVYARLTGSGLTTLDADGRAVRTYHAGSGLIAATQQGSEPPVWVVAGTDQQGTNRAAAMFDESALRDHFAVAVTPSGAIPLPAEG